MRLIDLEPVWLSPDVFMFKNPTGGDDWLICKRVMMSRHEQWDIAEKNAPSHIPRNHIVPCKIEMAWKFTENDFNIMTVKPSINAESSGNWHGFITKGEIINA